MCRSRRLVNVHKVPVWLIQSLCAVCGSNLAGLTLLYIVSVVYRPAWRMLLLIVQFVINQINVDYYYYYYSNSVICC